EPSFTPTPKGCAAANDAANRKDQSSFCILSTTVVKLFASRARGQFVAAIVVFVVGMTFGPTPGDPMARGESVKVGPQILVHHRLACARSPSIALPATNPFADAVFQILRIGDDFDLARLANRTQTL